MIFVVEGEFSKDADILSGIAQGTVLWPILFLVHINDLSECVSSGLTDEKLSPLVSNPTFAMSHLGTQIHERVLSQAVYK